MIKKLRQYFFLRGKLIKLGSTDRHFAEMLQRLRENKPFTFSRWGDGEWEAVLDLKDQGQENCDGHQFFDSMRSALAEIIKKKVDYPLGMQRLAYYKMMGNKIDVFLKRHDALPPQVRWIDADVFHDANVAGKITLFFNELARKRVLLVGPRYLQKFACFKFDLIATPEKNAWLERERVLNQIREAVTSSHFDAILFCVGMTSNWLIDQMHGFFPGFILDIGSLLDPFAGKTTRNYHIMLKKKYPDLL